MSIARSPSSRSALYDCTEGEGSGCEGSITPPLPSRLCHSSTPSTRSVKLSPLDQAWAQERLRRCHLCAAHLSPNAELYFLDDAVYCCASHRARSAAVDRFSNEAKSLVATAASDDGDRGRALCLAQIVVLSRGGCPLHRPQELIDVKRELGMLGGWQQILRLADVFWPMTCSGRARAPAPGTCAASAQPPQTSDTAAEPP
eukprot:CAMPEP_0180008954 /NCGR_PEP_ID=MMETSP0984-20121128/14732_1 /TAXON_ID=483367 /ORGANISM="non described non described, Strain CCMP 2436" /LENGTH=200 /DNA_ID=CAMNT_0021930223 /DNA_START=48 /DNA_END=646 /DNA_ORIENTATION=-